MENSNLPKLPTAEDMKDQINQNARMNLYKTLVEKWSVCKPPTSKSEESYEEQTRILEASRITTKTPQKVAETLLSIDGESFIEREDSYLIKGKPKSGKTTLCKAIIHATLVGRCCNIVANKPGLIIVYIDTEQKFADTQQILNNVRESSSNQVSDDYIDSHFYLYGMRKRDYTQLCKDLLRIVVDYHPDILICDGIADFVRSFNDEEASREIILLQLRIIEEFNCAIIDLIHENKARDDHNAKGHLGQLESQKAAIIIDTKKEGNIIKASCSASRHKTMPDVYLKYDDNGMICDATELYKTQKKDKQVASSYLEVASDIIRETGGSILRSELSKKMAEKMERSPQWMSTVITNLNNKGLTLIGNMVQLNTPEEQDK